MSLVLSETPAPGIRRLTLNLPEKRNPLLYELKEALWDGLDAALEDDDVRALVITGAGTAFSAGGDLDAMARGDTDFMGVNLELNHKIVRRTAQAAKPVITAVQGPAVGAGLGVALNADCVVVSESAVLGVPFFRLGLIPDGGLVYFLTRRIGHARARQAIMRAQSFTGADAHAIGLADELAADAALQERAVEIALEMGAMSSHAVVAAKNLLSAHPCDLETSLTAERYAQMTCLRTAEHAEGVAAFFEKRKPDFIAAGKRESEAQ
ncbi:MAG: enoyl-CoA hydratase/isomerase family protein [Alphaproteobacteria bacterium]